MTGAPSIGASAGCQQALHLFFQQYSDGHADDLANTCVLLICEGIASRTLIWQPLSQVLSASHFCYQGQAIHMQCKFVLKLLDQTDLPAQAVHEAVCANNVQLGMPADAVARWLFSSQ